MEKYKTTRTQNIEIYFIFLIKIERVDGSLMVVTFKRPWCSLFSFLLQQILFIHKSSVHLIIDIFDH